jgi:hypothetical protein
MLSSFFVEGIAVSIVESMRVLLFHLWRSCCFLLWGFVVSSCGVLAAAVLAVNIILLCVLSLGKLSFSPYDKDQTLEV